MCVLHHLSFKLHDLIVVNWGYLLFCSWNFCPFLLDARLRLLSTLWWLLLDSPLYTVYAGRPIKHTNNAVVVSVEWGLALSWWNNHGFPGKRLWFDGSICHSKTQIYPKHQWDLLTYASHLCCGHGRMHHSIADVSFCTFRWEKSRWSFLPLPHRTWTLWHFWIHILYGFLMNITESLVAFGCSYGLC